MDNSANSRAAGNMEPTANPSSESWHNVSANGPTNATNFNSSNISEYLLNEHLIAMFGPKRDPLYVVIPITCIYLVIFVTGVVGNISTCIVIARNRSMHTATNYYLFSLAVSDFLLLIAGVPQEMYLIWSKYPYVFGEVFCVMRGMMAEAAANATVLTITAFTVERYVAICHPFLSHTMSKLSRAVRLIGGIWVLSIVLAVPQALQFGVFTVDGLDYCDVTRTIIEHSFELSTFVFFVGPMSLITVLYVLIGLKLRSASQMPRASGATLQRRSPQNSSLRQQTNQGTRRVLKMLVAVVVAFFLCWAPFHAQRLVAIYGTMNEHLRVYVVMTYVSGILYYMSTCINPLLYNLMSNKFREAFKETLASCCPTAARADHQKRAYRILSRGQRARTGRLESTDYSGSSLRDDSFYTTTAHRQSADPATGHCPPAIVAATRISTTSSSSCNGTSSAVPHVSIDETAHAGVDALAVARCETASNGRRGAEFAAVHTSCGGHGGDASDSHGRQRSSVMDRSNIRNAPVGQSCIVSNGATDTTTPTAAATEQPNILRRLQFWQTGASRRQRTHRTHQRVNKHIGYYSPTMEQQNQRLKALAAGKRTDRRQMFVDLEESLLESFELTVDAAETSVPLPAARHETALTQIASCGSLNPAESTAGEDGPNPIDELSAYMHELRMREQS